MSAPWHGHQPIKMRRVPNGTMMKRAGDFCWRVARGGQRSIAINLPNLNGPPLHSTWTINHQNGSGDSWRWNGNSDLPTLESEICLHGFWRGFVRDGYLVEK